MYILKNFWFRSLMREFFFGLDKVIYGLIAKIYDLIIIIARTSPLSQADIARFSSRIYELLAIFMVFKVTFSLIMYVVNPDDFTEKSKGISKLTVNIIISLALLILTPFIFSYAYRLQEIILESNALANLIFGENNSQNSFFNTAGEDMAFTAFSPFAVPNVSSFSIYGCSNLMIKNTYSDKTDSDPDIIFNRDCSGLNEKTWSVADPKPEYKTLYDLTNSKETKELSDTMLKNYITGMNNKSFGLAYRADLLTAADSSKEAFVFDYSYFISTAVGVLVVLLLVSYCLDIGTRSVKLAFLQLIAPIPIISYVDPKSGKDGLFKKWYKMCFSTYLSLFIRLIVLYFAIFIISQVSGKLVNISTGAYYTTNVWVSLFILIGALMFAKQFPKILENLGIKLDGGGKFTLNPLKKMESDMIGGKILKKPNEFLEKVGKGIAKAPISGLKTGTMKVLSGANARFHGQSFGSGARRYKGGLGKAIDKAYETYLPFGAEARKEKVKGKEELAAMDRKWYQGKDMFEQMIKRGITTPKDALDGTNRTAYEAAGFNGEFLESKMKLDAKDNELKKFRALVQAAQAGDPNARATLSTRPGGLQGALEQLAKDEKALKGLQDVHDSNRRRFEDQARIEDSFKFYKNNDENPTNGDAKPNNHK